MSGRRAMIAGTASLLAATTVATASPAGASATASWVRQDLRIPVDGIELAAAWFRPVGQTGRLPGIVIAGPFGSVKEQSPIQYATRLAAAGYVCLVFDARGSGESGGEPRRTESPAGRAADIRAAITAMAGDPAINPARIGALGICQGASYMIATAASDPRIRALACVSGQYLYRENLEGFFGGGGPTLEQRIARGQAALARQTAGGPTEYIPVISPTNRAVALPWPQINDWYARWDGVGWGGRTRWENRVTATSDAKVWTMDVRSPAAKVRVPTLIVHGEQSDGFVVAAQTMHDALTVADRKLVIVPGVFHTRFYDDPEIVDGAVRELMTWFEKRL